MHNILYVNLPKEVWLLKYIQWNRFISGYHLRHVGLSREARSERNIHKSRSTLAEARTSQVHFYKQHLNYNKNVIITEMDNYNNSGLCTYFFLGNLCLNFKFSPIFFSVFIILMLTINHTFRTTDLSGIWSSNENAPYAIVVIEGIYFCQC